MFKIERDGAVVYCSGCEYLIVEPAPVTGYNFFYMIENGLNAGFVSRVGWARDFDPSDFYLDSRVTFVLKVLLDRHCATTEAMVTDPRLVTMIESAHNEDFEFRLRFQLALYD